LKTQQLLEVLINDKFPPCTPLPFTAYIEIQAGRECDKNQYR